MRNSNLASEFQFEFLGIRNCPELLEFESEITFLSQNEVSYMFSIRIKHEKLKSSIKISIGIPGNLGFWNLDAKLTSVTTEFFLTFRLGQ